MADPTDVLARISAFRAAWDAAEARDLKRRTEQLRKQQAEEARRRTEWEALTPEQRRERAMCGLRQFAEGMAALAEWSRRTRLRIQAEQGETRG